MILLTIKRLDLKENLVLSLIEHFSQCKTSRFITELLISIDKLFFKLKYTFMIQNIDEYAKIIISFMIRYFK